MKVKNLQRRQISPRQGYTKRAQPEKFICWCVMCSFPLGAGFLLHLERETAHDRPTNRQFYNHMAENIIRALALRVKEIIENSSFFVTDKFHVLK